MEHQVKIFLWQESDLKKEMLITTDIALTTLASSRTFGGVITVEWLPDFFDSAISVTIKSGENLLKIMKFTTSGSKTFEVSHGTTITARGKFTAVFNGKG